MGICILLMLLAQEGHLENTVVDEQICFKSSDKGMSSYVQHRNEEALKEMTEKLKVRKSICKINPKKGLIDSSQGKFKYQ